jgi:ketopantoate reductase
MRVGVIGAGSMGSLYNDAVTLLLKGVEKHSTQTLRGPAIDYDRLEAEAAKEHG